MNALIFLVPEDIVDIRPRLVSPPSHLLSGLVVTHSAVDHDVRRQSHGHRRPVRTMQATDLSCVLLSSTSASAGVSMKGLDRYVVYRT